MGERSTTLLFFFSVSTERALSSKNKISLLTTKLQQRPPETYTNAAHIRERKKFAAKIIFTGWRNASLPLYDDILKDSGREKKVLFSTVLFLWICGSVSPNESGRSSHTSVLFNASDSNSLRRREGFIRSKSLLSAPPSGRLHNISFIPRPPRSVPRCICWHACLLTTAVHDWRGLVVLWVEWRVSPRRLGRRQPNLTHSKSGGTFGCLNATKQRESFLSERVLL